MRGEGFPKGECLRSAFFHLHYLYLQDIRSPLEEVQPSKVIEAESGTHHILGPCLLTYINQKF